MATQSISGLTKIAEGREAEIFAWEDGAVVKLYRHAGSGGAAASESAAMAAAKAAGGPVPASRGVIELEARSGLVMDRIEGADLLTIIGRKPWAVMAAGNTCGRTHAALHEVAAPSGLERLVSRVVRQIQSSPLVPADLRDRAIAALSALPDGDRLLHGDFHPGNVISTELGPVVIDWTNASTGDPAADVARTLMLLRLGELPPGSPRLLMLLAKVARGILIGRYLSAYRRSRPLDDTLVQRWMLAVAVHRLSEDISEERERLLKFIAEL
jgi:aminoglycoside phosphotransferase (APT) family kinase protein